MLSLQYQRLDTEFATKHSRPRGGVKVETQVLFPPSHCTALCKMQSRLKSFIQDPSGSWREGDELWSLRESRGGAGGLAAPMVLLRDGARGKSKELMSDQAVAVFLLPTALHLVGRLG